MTEQFDFTTTSESVVHPRVDTSVFDEDVRADAKRIVDRYPESRSALLPLLHLVQSVQGHVTAEGMEFCAEQLALSTAEVSAVATFYTMYKRKPCGQHLVSVCTNTLCAALGGDAIYRGLSEHLGVGHEETAGTPGEQGSITLEHAECLAACDLGPVLQVNYEYYDKQTSQSAQELVEALQRGEKPAPSRGAPLTDFRSAERQLAGFFDEPAGSGAGDGQPGTADSGARQAVHGPSAAPETLQGARLAHENGWTAPAMPDNAELPPLPEKK
ncbi:NADH dehydrogenase subunit E [Halopolyspora algeriensis]|uniref:NADH dehydrogenase subunit E n=1 Tax=Halopolyspora algeriensis TaxID=1500506 RepID=A0A368W0W8_9ACTN|nr:NADH-quinone oxidoreductase subunit NuoE [Halopolyspora algeriensis]RCW46864.1 NADH dehydrogenase subunit E [Halopolyspora algeriensis]TQM47955.1 NADH dehydrogenase subunit E [Halopolyspora algeriensis]